MNPLDMAFKIERCLDDFPLREYLALHREFLQKVAAALRAAPPQQKQVEPVVTPPCKGMNCGATDGRSHSLECHAEHSSAIAGGRFVPGVQAEPVAWALRFPDDGKAGPVGLCLSTVFDTEQEAQEYASKCSLGTTVVPLVVPHSSKQAEPVSALTRYNEIVAEDPADDMGGALERLRFFCSLSMPGQDWLDVEPFFDAVEAQQAKPVQAEPVVERVVQFRKRHCADWYDGHADHEDGGGPYEERVLYTHPPQQAEPVAWLSIDRLGERYLCFSKPLDNDPVFPLFAHPPRRAA